MLLVLAITPHWPAGWWLDPVIGLAIAAVAVREGTILAWRRLRLTATGSRQGAAEIAGLRAQMRRCATVPETLPVRFCDGPCG